MFEKELKGELEIRWSKIKNAIKAANIESCLISDTINLYYTTGRVFNGYTYITQNREPLFFVRRPIGLVNGKISYIRKAEDIIEKLEKLGYPIPASIALEADSLTYNEYNRLASVFNDSAKYNLTPIIRDVRAIKTPYEIEKMRESGRRHAAVCAHVTSVYQDGMTDDEVCIELEGYARRLGNLGIFRIFGSSMEIFMGSVLAGENADTPSPYDFALGGEGISSSLPVGANGTILKPGMTLMVDMGGNFTGYMTDMTRVYSIRELKSDLAKSAHQASLDIHKWVRENVKPGIAAADIYNYALELAKSRQLDKYFMGHKQQAGFVGHGVGLEINESPVLAPRSKHILAEGMTFALEPKFVIPGVGAVGIENTYAVTSTGTELLTLFNEDIIELS